MTREAITLVLAMLLATLVTAACEKAPAPQAGSAGPVNPGSPAPSAAPPDPARATTTERKDGGAPVQGQVDTKQPEQRRDFEQKK